MKKLLLSLLLTIFISSLGYSQWHISAGPTITNYSGTTRFDFDIKKFQKPGIGFFGKISREIPLNKHVFIEPGFGFNSTNTEEKSEGFSYKTSNVIIPVEIGVKIGDKIHLNTGIQGNITLSAKTKKGREKTDISDEYKSGYFDWIGGFTFIPSKRVGLMFRYNINLGDIIEKTDISKNVFSLGLRVRL